MARSKVILLRQDSIQIPVKVIMEFVTYNQAPEFCGDVNTTVWKMAHQQLGNSKLTCTHLLEACSVLL